MAELVGFCDRCDEWAVLTRTTFPPDDHPEALGEELDVCDLCLGELADVEALLVADEMFDQQAPILRAATHGDTE